MARYLRSKRLRNLLWIEQQGRCALCGRELPETGWHADHTLPWSKGGLTNVHLMKALCQECNLKKGDSMADRQHQAELREIASRIHPGNFPLKILAHVVPGGGKSRLPGILASHFRTHKLLWFVPRLSLRKQAMINLQKDFGITVRDSGNDLNPSRGTRGCVVTHQSLTQEPRLWWDFVKAERSRVIVVVDECHHAKIERNGQPSQLAAALAGMDADIWLNMTGTLETSDGCAIHGMRYRDCEDGLIVDCERSADHFIRYDRQSALREQALVPIEFHHNDGPVEWQRLGELATCGGRLSDVNRKQEGEAIYTALRTGLAAQLFSGGIAHWRSHPRRGKLIVCVHSQQAAEQYVRILREQGIRTALAINDNPDASVELDGFRDDDNVLAMVTCAMAYEGLDVPSATHLICLTHIRSVPWIEQMLGRVWRKDKGKTTCYAFVPDDPKMNRVIEKIKAEEPALIPFSDLPSDRGGSSGGDGFSTILALHSEVDDIRRKMLDAGFAPDEITDKVVRLVRELGLTGEEPEVAALLRRIRESKIPQPIPKTVSETEYELRSQISDSCRQLNIELGNKKGIKPPWGTAEKWLFSQTGKSLSDMSVEELRRAFAKLKEFRP